MEELTCYGKELLAQVTEKLNQIRSNQDAREDRMRNCEYDLDDCFISTMASSLSEEKYSAQQQILQNQGYAEFTVFATLDGKLCEGKLCHTMYGDKYRVEMPDGSVVWTSAFTSKGLARRGLKLMKAKHTAWAKLSGEGQGFSGLSSCSAITFPTRKNFFTGKPSEGYFDLKDTIVK